MCNACGNVCCGSDEFYGCGCDGCDEPDCWSDDEDDGDDMDDPDYYSFACCRETAFQCIETKDA